MEWKPLPVGIDDFEKIVTGDYFYVDKTLFIKDLLDMKGEVNLFTRPRRFGKTRVDQFGTNARIRTGYLLPPRGRFN